MDLNGERDEGRVGGGANRLSSKRYDKTPCRMGKGPAACRAKEVPSFLSYFKT